MLNDEGLLNVQYVKDVHKLKVQVHITSHSKIYRCFIEYILNSIGGDSIKRYFCECVNRRTVDYCAHIAAIVYYLAYARYLAKIPRPAQILNAF